MSGEAVEMEQPQSSSQEIAASVVETAEATETPSTPVAEAGPTETPAEPMTPAEAKLSAAAEFLVKMGHKQKTADGRDTWFKFSTAEKFLDRYVDEQRAAWDSRYSTLEKQAKELEAFREELINDARGTDTRKFLERVAEFNPAFRSYLQPAPAPQAEPVAEKPQPDIDLGNGRWAYSVEQNEKLVEWKAQQLLDQRLKPIEEREKIERERAAEAQAQEALKQRVTSQIDEAKHWPNWADYEADVLKLLQADTEQAKAAGRRPTMTLKEAYQEAKIQYLSADDTAKRQRWIEESNKAAKSTAVVQRGVEHTRPPGPRSTADIVREVVAQAEQSR